MGLGTDDGGSPDVGGATGAAGKTGGAGTTGTAGLTGTAGVTGAGGTSATGQAGAGGSCGAVCDIFCQWGHATDAAGCPLCKCNPPPQCQPADCGPQPLIPAHPPCSGGGSFSVTCTRNDMGACVWTGACQGCPATTCPLSMCPYGIQTDANGCAICACNPPPKCTPQQCGPAPGVPSMMCSDGSVAGPVCGPTAVGTCGWTITKCPPPVCPAIACLRACPNGARTDANGCPTCDCIEPTSCATYTDYKRCVGDMRCEWLQPGCGQPALATGGCFARTEVGCAGDASCSGGRQCLSRVVDPCYNPLGGGTCAACGVTQMICL